eukprot:TRINITY_DN830_c0_g2_i1.p1 TRINITY_DN830_c0_g2~~TRINITY_DN830_c0_g2_i1.p1  ORF type:complete len:2557 (+),score=619.96 TRINITY_DN830_c0_g2_i1:79-7671(+)
MQSARDDARVPEGVPSPLTLYPLLTFAGTADGEGEEEEIQEDAAEAELWQLLGPEPSGAAPAQQTAPLSQWQAFTAAAAGQPQAAQEPAGPDGVAAEGAAVGAAPAPQTPAPQAPAPQTQAPQGAGEAAPPPPDAQTAPGSPPPPGERLSRADLRAALAARRSRGEGGAAALLPVAREVALRQACAEQLHAVSSFSDVRAMLQDCVWLLRTAGAPPPGLAADAAAAAVDDVEAEAAERGALPTTPSRERPGASRGLRGRSERGLPGRFQSANVSGQAVAPRFTSSTVSQGPITRVSSARSMRKGPAVRGTVRAAPGDAEDALVSGTMALAQHHPVAAVVEAVALAGGRRTHGRTPLERTVDDSDAHLDEMLEDIELTGGAADGGGEGEEGSVKRPRPLSPTAAAALADGWRAEGLPRRPAAAPCVLTSQQQADCVQRELVGLWYNKTFSGEGRQPPTVLDELIDNLCVPRRAEEGPDLGSPLGCLAEYAEALWCAHGHEYPHLSRAALLVLALCAAEGPDLDRLLQFQSAPPPLEWGAAAAQQWDEYLKAHQTGKIRRNPGVMNDAAASLRDLCALAAPGPPPDTLEIEVGQGMLPIFPISGGETVLVELSAGGAAVRSSAVFPSSTPLWADRLHMPLTPEADQLRVQVILVRPAEQREEVAGEAFVPLQPPAVTPCMLESEGAVVRREVALQPPDGAAPPRSPLLAASSQQFPGGMVPLKIVYAASNAPEPPRSPPSRRAQTRKGASGVMQGGKEYARKRAGKWVKTLGLLQAAAQLPPHGGGASHAALWRGWALPRAAAADAAALHGALQAGAPCWWAAPCACTPHSSAAAEQAGAGLVPGVLANVRGGAAAVPSAGLSTYPAEATVLLPPMTPFTAVEAAPADGGGTECALRAAPAAAACCGTAADAAALRRWLQQCLSDAQRASAQLARALEAQRAHRGRQLSQIVAEGALREQLRREARGGPPWGSGAAPPPLPRELAARLQLVVTPPPSDAPREALWAQLPLAPCLSRESVAELLPDLVCMWYDKDGDLADELAANLVLPDGAHPLLVLGEIGAALAQQHNTRAAADRRSADLILLLHTLCAMSDAADADRLLLLPDALPVGASAAQRQAYAEFWGERRNASVLPEVGQALATLAEHHRTVSAAARGEVEAVSRRELAQAQELHRAARDDARRWIKTIGALMATASQGGSTTMLRRTGHAAPLEAQRIRGLTAGQWVAWACPTRCRRAGDAEPPVAPQQQRQQRVELTMRGVPSVIDTTELQRCHSAGDPAPPVICPPFSTFSVGRVSEAGSALQVELLHAGCLSETQPALRKWAENCASDAARAEARLRAILLQADQQREVNNRTRQEIALGRRVQLPSASELRAALAQPHNAHFRWHLRGSGTAPLLHYAEAEALGTVGCVSEVQQHDVRALQSRIDNLAAEFAPFDQRDPQAAAAPLGTPTRRIAAVHFDTPCVVDVPGSLAIGPLGGAEETVQTVVVPTELLRVHPLTWLPPLPSGVDLVVRWAVPCAPPQGLLRARVTVDGQGDPQRTGAQAFIAPTPQGGAAVAGVSWDDGAAVRTVQLSKAPCTPIGADAQPGSRVVVGAQVDGPLHAACGAVSGELAVSVAADGGEPVAVGSVAAAEALAWQHRSCSLALLQPPPVLVVDAPAPAGGTYALAAEMECGGLPCWRQQAVPPAPQPALSGVDSRSCSSFPVSSAAPSAPPPCGECNLLLHWQVSDLFADAEGDHGQFGMWVAAPAVAAPGAGPAPGVALRSAPLQQPPAPGSGEPGASVLPVLPHQVEQWEFVAPAVAPPAPAPSEDLPTLAIPGTPPGSPAAGAAPAAGVAAADPGPPPPPVHVTAHQLAKAAPPPTAAAAAAAAARAESTVAADGMWLTPPPRSGVVVWEDRVRLYTDARTLAERTLRVHIVLEEEEDDTAVREDYDYLGGAGEGTEVAEAVLTVTPWCVLEAERGCAERALVLYSKEDDTAPADGLLYVALRPHRPPTPPPPEPPSELRAAPSVPGVAGVPLSWRDGDFAADRICTGCDAGGGECCEADWVCAQCDAKLCDPCWDAVHVGVNADHRRLLLFTRCDFCAHDTATGAAARDRTTEAPAVWGCDACGLSLCRHCWVDQHRHPFRREHQRRPLYPAGWQERVAASQPPAPQGGRFGDAEGAVHWLPPIAEGSSVVELPLCDHCSAATAVFSWPMPLAATVGPSCTRAQLLCAPCREQEYRRYVQEQAELGWVFEARQRPPVGLALRRCGHCQGLEGRPAAWGCPQCQLALCSGCWQSEHRHPERRGHSAAPLTPQPGDPYADTDPLQGLLARVDAALRRSSSTKLGEEPNLEPPSAVAEAAARWRHALRGREGRMDADEAAEELRQRRAGEVGDRRRRDGEPFSSHRGCLTRGSDACEPQWVTLAEAKAKSLQLEGCVGFTFRGSDPCPQGRVKVYFKTRWALRAADWVSFRVEDEPVLGLCEHGLLAPYCAACSRCAAAATAAAPSAPAHPGGGRGGGAAAGGEPSAGTTDKAALLARLLWEDAERRS